MVIYSINKWSLFSLLQAHRNRRTEISFTEKVLSSKDVIENVGSCFPATTTIFNNPNITAAVSISVSASPPYNAGFVRLAVVGTTIGPFRLLLVPRTREVFQDKSREVQKHCVPYKHSSDVSFLHQC